MSRRSLQNIAIVLLIAVVWPVARQIQQRFANESAPEAVESRTVVREVALLNVSYDPTRELWQAVNAKFVTKYESETGVKLTIKQSHAASGSQARAIADGLEADVATLSLWPDLDLLRKKDLIKAGWEDEFPNGSVPYFSTVVFVVRKGNPKGIHDWADLGKPDTSIITPSPKTSGNGRLALLGAWGSVVLQGGSEENAREFVTRIYRNVPVLDTGARGATVTFSQKGIGDVHLAVESEARLEVRESNGELELVYPTKSIRHDPPVAIVDAVVERRGTQDVAKSYLDYLYTPEGQAVIAEHDFRPLDAEVLAKFADRFPKVELFTVEDIGPNWDAVQKKFFAEGALFDSVYQEIHRSDSTK